MNQTREMLTRRVSPLAVPMFGTLTVADTPVADTGTSLKAVMKATGSLFRSFPHLGANVFGQISPSKYDGAGYVHPHIHTLVWTDPQNPVVDWLDSWRSAVDTTQGGLIAECADVSEARDLGQVAGYISRGPVDVLDWAELTEEFAEVVTALKGLRLSARIG